MKREEKKKVAQLISQVLEALPNEKREYLLGYADGVLAMTSAAKEQAEPRPSA